MNNIKYNVIIIIFVLIFILYFYLENNIINYKNVKKTNEHFQSNSSQINTIINNVFSDMKSINNNLEQIIDNKLNIQNIIKGRKFIFLDIVNNKDFKKHLHIIISYLNKNNKIYNNIITALGSHSSINYILKLKVLFISFKNMNNDYILYYNSDFSFTDDNFKQNQLILDKKIKIEQNIIKHHGNIKYLIDNLIEELPKYSLSKNLYDFLKKYLTYEKTKNNLFNELIENSGLYIILKILHNFYKEKKKISKNDGKNFNDGVIKKKTILGSISKLVIDENNFIDDGINFKLNEQETKNREIEYLYSSNNNNNVLANFCKKIKKLDKPSEGNLITKRLHKEFKNKKNIQLVKLEKEIDNIINSMTSDEITKFNSYIIRTHDQSSKQLDAIHKAKDNLENAKKIKINVS
jgi:hypothetical protein